MGRGQVGGAAARRAEICSPLRASLHPHQLDGVRWLFKAFCRGGGILADDPGLGKTLQTIAVVEALTRARLASTVLVVVPANLVKNWEAELRRWLGRTKFRLDVIVVGDPGLDAAEKLKQIVDGAPGTYRLGLVSYETLGRHARALSGGRALDALVTDEAHRLRNNGVCLSVCELLSDSVRFFSLAVPRFLLCPETVS